jgi:hypothetical protein
MKSLLFKELSKLISMNCGSGSIKQAFWELGIKPVKNVQGKNKSLYVGVYSRSVVPQIRKYLKIHGYKQI